MKEIAFVLFIIVAAPSGLTLGDLFHTLESNERRQALGKFVLMVVLALILLGASWGGSQ